MATILHKTLISLTACLAVLVACPASRQLRSRRTTGSCPPPGRCSPTARPRPTGQKPKSTTRGGSEDQGHRKRRRLLDRYHQEALRLRDVRHYRYRAGGLKKYTGKVHPKRLRGRIVGYAVATIPTKSGEGAPRPQTPKPPPVDCSSVTSRPAASVRRPRPIYTARR